MNHEEVPADRLERNPLMTPASWATLRRILEHPHAPRWNFVTGDRIGRDDLPSVEAYRDAVASERTGSSPLPPPHVLDKLARLRDRVRILGEGLPAGDLTEAAWARVPTTCREDLATRPEDFAPVGSDFSRLITYLTSGTTGHPLRIPHHPVAQAQNHALCEVALARHGVRPDFGPDRVACINLSALQRNTVIFATTFSVWEGAGFAKVNLQRADWRQPRDAAAFFEDLAPLFLTGDPVGFAELLRWEIPARPGALLSTATALSRGLADALRTRFGCPVVDWYSSGETGPIAYGCPMGGGYHILPHDLFVEVVDAEGNPAKEGERGEITVTGGHNPFVPLLRYRTGDWARLDASPCPCGEVTPRLRDLEGRDPVLFRASDGSAVNAVDLGRILHAHPVLQHEVVQRADGSCDVALRPAPGARLDLGGIAAQMATLLGEAVPLRVREVGRIGGEGPGEKVRAYRTEIEGNLTPPAP